MHLLLTVLFIFPLIGDGQGDLMLDRHITQRELGIVAERLYNDAETYKELASFGPGALFNNTSTPATIAQLRQAEYKGDNKERAYYLPIQVEEYERGYVPRSEVLRRDY